MTTSEYRAALESAAFFDLSACGKLEAAGKDAAAFLHNLSTNDIKRLTPGHGCEAFFTNAKARVLAYVWIQCAARGDTVCYEIDTAPSLGEILFQHLNHYLISEQVELADQTGTLAELHLAGPRAVEMAEHVRDSCQVRRHDRLGLPGFDLLFPRVSLAKLEQLLVERGVAPAGLPVFDTLRIEAGIPAHGAEIDDTRLAMELSRTAQAICYTKGCYLGQETIVMARDRGHVNRTLLGLKLTGREPATAGAKVFRGEEEIGQVTSSVCSPRAGQAIALALLKRGHQQPGTAVEVVSELGRQRAAIADLPCI
jgi:folate-binding protein YgfZ